MVNSTLNLFCNISASIPLTYRWFKDGILLPEFISENYTRPFISSIDDGLYTCAVNDSFQTLRAPDFNVTVWGKRFNLDYIVSYVFDSVKLEDFKIPIYFDIVMLRGLAYPSVLTAGSKLINFLV